MSFQPWRAIYLSFFSREFYRGVANNWRGTGFLYLWLLLMVTCIPTSVQTYIGFDRVLSMMEPVLHELPAVTVNDGKLSIDRPSPYLIKDQKNGRPIFLFDTTGSTTKLEPGGPVCLVTADHIYTQDTKKTAADQQQGKDSKASYDLSSVKHFSMNADDVSKWEAYIHNGVAPLYYSLSLLFGFSAATFQALAYSGLVSLLRAGRPNLRYVQLLRLCSVALTPVILIDTVARTINLAMGLPGLVAITVAVAYCAFAVRAARSASPSLAIDLSSSL